MKEYRGHAKCAAALDAHTSARKSLGVQPEKWQTLDQQYGLDDMYELDADQEDQTAEQEYQSYVTGILCKAGTDMVKFWDVRVPESPCTSILLMKIWNIDRSVNLYTQLSSILRWTIFQSRCHQFPVNVYFPHLARRILQNGTA